MKNISAYSMLPGDSFVVRNFILKLPGLKSKNFVMCSVHLGILGHEVSKPLEDLSAAFHRLLAAKVRLP